MKQSRKQSPRANSNTGHSYSNKNKKNYSSGTRSTSGTSKHSTRSKSNEEYSGKRDNNH